jgi:ribosomal protein S18 acetylase RimI-like enzyme
MLADLDKVSLRAATDGDFWFAYDAKKAALAEYVAQVWGWDEDFQRDFHRREFKPDGTDIIVYDGREIGLLRVEHQPDHVYVRHLYILPEAQNRGIGSHIMKGIVEEAGQKNLPVRLHVLKVNRGAGSLYGRLGFKTIKETDTHYKMQTLGVKDTRAS